MPLNKETKRNIGNSLWFRFETFIYLLEFKVFRHEERETQFLTMLTDRPSSALNSLTQSTRGHPVCPWYGLAQIKNRLTSSSVGSQLTAFFQIPKSSAHRFRAWRHSHPQSHPIWVFYCDICDCHIFPRAREHLTNPCTKQGGSEPN